MHSRVRQLGNKRPACGTRETGHVSSRDGTLANKRTAKNAGGGGDATELERPPDTARSHRSVASRAPSVAAGANAVVALHLTEQESHLDQTCVVSIAQECTLFSFHRAARRSLSVECSCSAAATCQRGDRD